MDLTAGPVLYGPQSSDGFVNQALVPHVRPRSKMVSPEVYADNGGWRELVVREERGTISRQFFMGEGGE